MAIMKHVPTLFFLLSTLLLSISVDSLPPPLFPDEALPTKSGYLPVKPAPGSSMFYAFYEAQKPTTPLPNDTPLLVWLQGGPGCSSMIGNFYELGPWRVLSNATNLEPNPGAWNRLFGLLFLDNPIGTGFSIAASKQDIPRNQKQVAEHLYAALTEFIEQNPGFENRPVYITGESYAGKYVPAIGYYILKEKPNGKVNLMGLAIGNGLTDPVIQIRTHAVNAYYSGLVNAKQRESLEKAQETSVALAKAQKWREATEARTELLTLLRNMTGLATLYNQARMIPYRTDLVVDLMNLREAKKVLGASETVRFEECSDDVDEALRGDVMKSVKFMVEYALERTHVLLYLGMLDLRDGVVSVEEWVKTMKWSGLGAFLKAERSVWKDGEGDLAGYVQRWGNLTQVAVSGAGHLVPTDKAVNSISKLSLTKAQVQTSVKSPAKVRLTLEEKGKAKVFEEDKPCGSLQSKHDNTASSSQSQDQRSLKVTVSKSKSDDKTQTKTSTAQAFNVKLSNSFSALDAEADS